MSLRCLSVVCLAALLILPLCQARAYRQKRPSDQRLHELETMLELSSLKGGVMNVPVGLNLDPDRLGRRKRTSELLKELLSQEQRTREEQEDEYNPHWISDIA